MIGNILSNNPASGKGYVVSGALAAAQSPADSSTYYLGACPAMFSTTAGMYQRVYVPKSGTIKAAQLQWFGSSAGSSEQVDVYVSVNGSSDTLIKSLSTSLQYKSFDNYSMNVAVSQGDYLYIKLATPAWATNPATVYMSWWIYIE